MRRPAGVGGTLLAAIKSMYAQSWRMVVANAALAFAVLPFAVAALWAPLALAGAALVAGPLAMALMHCAVDLVEEDDLSLGCWREGLGLHWRRGLLLGGACGLVFAAGGVALATYGGGGQVVLAIVVLYVLIAFAAYQVALWPLAVVEPFVPLTQVARAAGEVLLRNPLPTIALALVLVLVNAAGAAAALMPLLTLTLAYSSLAAAHYALPRNPLQEA